MIYECKRCGYNSIHKSDLEKHLSRKTPCEAKQSSVSVEELKKELEQQIESKTYTCNGCHKRFAHGSSCSRHRKECEDRAIQENKGVVAEINGDHNNMTVENHVHIHINAFDNPSTAHIKDDYVKRLLEVKRFAQIENAMVNLCKRIYFNERHPENFNAYIPNKKQKEALVWDGSEWKWMTREDVIKSMRDNTYIYIADKYDESEDDFHLYTQQEWQCFFNRVKKEDVKVFKDVDKRIGLELLNNTAKVKEHIKGKRVITDTTK